MDEINCTMKLTMDILQAGRSPSGGWNANQLRALGIKGFENDYDRKWMGRAIGLEVTADQVAAFLSLRSKKKAKKIKPDASETRLPEVGIVCDASLIDGNGSIQRDGYYHGRGEWQSVDLSTGEFVVRSHIQRRSTINIAELCSVIDSLKYLDSIGDTTTPVYNDNQYAVAWAISMKPNTKLPRNADTMDTHYDLEERMNWLRSNRPPNPILWYDKNIYGPNPADFGRK